MMLIPGRIDKRDQIVARIRQLTRANEFTFVGRKLGMVWMSMADGLDEADEFVFISGKLGMVRRDGMTEEGNQLAALMQDGAEFGAGGVVVHGEWLGEVG
jgi:enamine deaminase RidA (YjgF/YER057c/UK114 family)